MTPLRVALFTDSNVFAGTERHMLELAGGLSRMGVSVKLACPSESALAQHALLSGIPIIRVEKRGYVDFVAVMRLARCLAEGEIDVLHAHNGRSAFIAALAKARAHRGHIVVTQHFINPARSSRRGGSALFSRIVHKWVNGRAASLIAISEAVRHAMILRGDDTKKIRTVFNGISEPDDTRLTGVEELRKNLQIPVSTPLVVCVARLEPEKDVATLVRAMGNVCLAHPAAMCVIAGEGSLHGQLEALIREAGLQDRIKLVGFIQDTLSLIRAADLFVLPSVAEPFGLVLLEAMALGKAVIATHAGGPKEIVESEKTGLLVAPGDPQSLSAAIGRLVSDPQLRQGMGEAGRERFMSKFTEQQMSKRTYDVYRNIPSISPLE